MENGKFVQKNRVTYDLAFPEKLSGKLINSRVKSKKLEPRKEDFKPEFRHLHPNALTAVRLTVRLVVRVQLRKIWYVVILLRMPFGGSPCPSEFAVVTYLTLNTINDLLIVEQITVGADIGDNLERITKAPIITSTGYSRMPM